MQPQPRGTRTIPKNTKATTWRHTGSCAHALLSATAPKSIAAKKKKSGERGKKKRVKSQEASTDVSAMPSRLSGWGSYAPNGGRLAHT